MTLTIDFFSAFFTSKVTSILILYTVSYQLSDGLACQYGIQTYKNIRYQRKNFPDVLWANAFRIKNIWRLPFSLVPHRAADYLPCPKSCHIATVKAKFRMQ